MKTATEFSPRSTASALREEGMLAEIAKLDKSLGHIERKTKECEEQKAGCLRAIAKGRGDGYTDIRLDRINEELRNLDARAESVKQFKAEIEHTLKAERVTAKDRAEIQQQVADLAEERLKADAGIEEIIRQLRAALDSRAQTTARMAELAEKIEFSGDLDAQRFAEFSAALPSFLQESTRRTAALLGVGVTVRAIARVRFQRAESLRSAGIVLPGQELLLTQEEFDELNRTDVAQPFTKIGEERLWALRTQQVCSIEQFEADTSEAERTGTTVEAVWAAQETTRDEAAKSKYVEERENRNFEAKVESIRQRTFPALDRETAVRVAEREQREGRTFHHSQV